MPFSRPSLTRLISRARGDIESTLQNGAVFLRRSFESAIARAMGGLSHSLHGHLEFIARQIIIDTAEEEFLVRWAEIFLGVNARKDPIKAEFSILVTGTVASAPVPQFTRWTRVDGQVFELQTAGITLPAAAPLEVSVTIEAVEAGQAGNTIPTSVLTLETGVANINADAVVEGAGTDAIGGGADIEDIEVLRTRLLDHLQTPPKGGALGDYIAWAKETPDVAVSRAFELPLQLGPGTILVMFVQDIFDANGNFVDTVFPGPADVTAVDAYITTQKPVTAVLTVQAPTESTLDPSIQLEPNTVEVQAQVLVQLNDLLLRESAPNTTLELSKINEAISIATGEDDHVLVSPVADVVIPVTGLLTIGTPIFAPIP